MSDRRTNDPASAGRSADRRGQDWQRRAAAWLRETGLFPAADHTGRQARPGQGDLSAIGDRVAECTIRPWPELAAKMRQAEHDAKVSGRVEWFVWRPMRGQPVAGSVVVFRADVAWQMMAELDRLGEEMLFERDRADAAEERADEAYGKGYEAGRKVVNVLAKGGVL